MKKFIIIKNNIKDEEFEITNKIKNILEKKGCTSYIYDGKLIQKDIDCAIVIGGDGTLLTASRMFVDMNIPIIGVNLGTLGYLAEVSIDELEEAFDKLLSGKYFIEKRMLLCGRLCKKNKEKEDKIKATFALNDIVVSKQSALSIIRYNLIVNDKLLYSYNADGIIVSTPTGSTGYSLSAGGPIVEPTAELFVITPICAHSLSARSVILSANDKIEIEVCNVRKNIKSQGSVVSDGIYIGELKVGDKLIINKSKRKTKIIKLSQESFLETMRNKMNV